MLSAVVFTFGGIVMGVAKGPEMIVAGRIIVGVAIGVVSVVVPIYVAECAPANVRGCLTTFFQLFITLGIWCSSIVVGVFAKSPHGWRYMFGLSAIPGILQFVFFLGLPESPRYLVLDNEIEEARSTLQRIRNTMDVKQELEDIIDTLEQSRDLEGANVLKRMSDTTHVQKALIVGCMLQFFQQFCGINAVIYYSANILKSAGFNVKLSIWLSVIPFTANFLATFVALWAVEKFGRKPVLTFSFLVKFRGQKGQRKTKGKLWMDREEQYKRLHYRRKERGLEGDDRRGRAGSQLFFKRRRIKKKEDRMSKSYQFITGYQSLTFTFETSAYCIAVAMLILVVAFLPVDLYPKSTDIKYEKRYNVTGPCTLIKDCLKCTENGACGFCGYQRGYSNTINGSCVPAAKGDEADLFAKSGRCARKKGTNDFQGKSRLVYSRGYCPSSLAWLAVVGLMMYLIGFAPGAGPMPWTINAEIYPLWCRSVANSFATLTNWGSNYAVTALFFTAIKTFTTWGTFLMFAVVCLLAAVFVHFLVPETMNVSLEHVEKLFMSSNELREAQRVQELQAKETQSAKLVMARDVVQEWKLRLATTI
ncbi:proton myo-inositol cotransporter [Plakobranchus ocellatus]|uniref:Proton myo-inositol cotransporter n=1 Tax=Plakobranchus ocellatus TaxID=259542 RepID=A0AAV3ZS75_9GAST|nr:proton myo-inositol cotransporter [Plakobranchus ocellatus]